MSTSDNIKQMRLQGKTESEIQLMLKHRGIPRKEILNILSQSQIKEAVTANTTNDLQNNDLSKNIPWQNDNSLFKPPKSIVQSDQTSNSKSWLNDSNSPSATTDPTDPTATKKSTWLNDPNSPIGQENTEWKGEQTLPQTPKPNYSIAPNSQSQTTQLYPDQIQQSQNQNQSLSQQPVPLLNQSPQDQNQPLEEYQAPQNQEAYQDQGYIQAPSQIGSEQGYPTTFDQYPQYQPYEQAMSSDIITEITEQIVSERLANLHDQLEQTIDFKTTAEAKITSIDDRLRRIEKIIDRLQLSILQKVGDFSNEIDNVRKELDETQKSFKAVKKHHHSHPHHKTHPHP